MRAGSWAWAWSGKLAAVNTQAVTRLAPTTKACHPRCSCRTWKLKACTFLPAASCKHDHRSLILPTAGSGRSGHPPSSSPALFAASLLTSQTFQSTSSTVLLSMASYTIAASPFHLSTHERPPTNKSVQHGLECWAQGKAFNRECS